MKWNVTGDLQGALEEASPEDVLILGDTLVKRAPGITDDGIRHLFQEVGLWLRDIAEIKADETS